MDLTKHLTARAEDSHAALVSFNYLCAVTQVKKSIIVY